MTSLLHPTSAAISSLPASLEEELKEAKLDYPRPDPNQMIAFKPRPKALIRKCNSDLKGRGMRLLAGHTTQEVQPMGHASFNNPIAFTLC